MKFNRPHIYFWITALITFLVSLFYSNSNAVIDINVHDTYYVISKFDLTLLIAFAFLVIGLLIFIFSKIKKN